MEGEVTARGTTSGRLEPAMGVGSASPSNLTARPRVPRLRRLFSAAVLGYIRRFPIEKGKWRLMAMATPKLLVELEPRVYIRTLGLSVVEIDIIREAYSSLKPWWQWMLAPGMCVLDIGANLGQYALMASPRVGPTGTVHAFEPTPDVARAMRESLAINGFQNVILNELALSDSTGTATLYTVANEDCGSNTINVPGAGQAIGEVRTITLDEYLLANKIEQVDAIKIDIEGAEPAAFRGAKQLLSKDPAPIIFLEINPNALRRGNHTEDQLLDQLREFGYEFYPLETYGTNRPDPWMNGIVAKPYHFDKYPALKEWDVQPLRDAEGAFAAIRGRAHGRRWLVAR